MKKIILCLLLLLIITPEAIASPGDTTWVTIYNIRKITQWGNYDTTAVLPTGKTYRKIKLHYILGRYACPAGTQYCGSWDYTTQVYVKPAANDTMEIARIITPYATDWLATNRKHDFVVDVSDYASVLNGNLDFRYKYDGYSWGFTLTLKLEMIEGTPPMEALAAKNIYDGNYSYGNTSDPIENHLIEKPFIYNSPVAKAFVKNTISGHGSDDNGCGEFCSKYYDLKINGAAVSQKQLWKSDCGLNNISPQTGTWLYERANWCPGQIVYPIHHDISSLTSPAATFSVDVDMEPYTSPTQSNAGGFNVVSQLISYGAPNFNTDVSIEDIISPNADPNYARANTICVNPKIKIKNTGTNPITQIVFSYSVTGGSAATYTWTGNLNFLDEAIVELGPTLPLYNGNATNQFNVVIDMVNGSSGDQNLFNNTYRSTYNAVKVYPNKFIVYYSANAATSTINPGYNESHWKITNDLGTVVYSRTNLANTTVYKDTVTLPDGCYTFTMDDDGCDGVSWWAYQYYNPNPGSGSLRFNKISPAIPLKSFNGDFGCQVNERFMTASLVTSIKDTEVKSDIQLFPNPAANILNLSIDVLEDQKMIFVITDITGKEVKIGQISTSGSEIYTINTENLLNGMYFITCKFEKAEAKTLKFIVEK
ncbi:MAG: T9SS type A sorting domain-containing protein [Burkholderiales bacterium]|nr:T9SS type A sorting domain-containing protein [Bacteroidia bacterium]